MHTHSFHCKKLTSSTTVALALALAHCGTATLLPAMHLNNVHVHNNCHELSFTRVNNLARASMRMKCLNMALYLGQPYT